MRTKYIEDPKLERQYRRLASIGQALKVPTFEAFLQMDVTLPDGRVMHSHKQRSHSWVRNAYNTLLSGLGALNASDANPNWGGGYINVKNTSGTITSQTGGICQPSGGVPQNLYSAGYGLAAAAGSTASGLLVGSGTNAESFEDYAIQTLIAHGTGANQLAYQATDTPLKTYDGPSKTLTIDYVRIMNNNGSGDVSVNEVVMYMKYYIATFMICRDVLVSTVTVPATGQLKCTYTFTLVFPA